MALTEFTYDSIDFKICSDTDDITGIVFSTVAPVPVYNRGYTYEVYEFGNNGYGVTTTYTYNNGSTLRRSITLWVFSTYQTVPVLRRYRQNTGSSINVSSQNYNLTDVSVEYPEYSFYAKNIVSMDYSISDGDYTSLNVNTVNIPEDKANDYGVVSNQNVDYPGTSLAYVMNSILQGETPQEDDDPYIDVGDNEVEGGGGDFDDSSIDIDFPPTPVISVADAGFVSLLTPTLSQIQALSSYMWSTSFDPSQVKKLFANPMDVFIGMSILPINIPSSSTKTIKIAGINTGLVMNAADSQFVSVDFGTLTIKTGTGGSYLDYSPYTKASIFLPYIGWRDIDIDEIMNKTLHLKYCVDIVSGGCVAWLKCGGSVLYEWTGQCAVNIPLTSIDFTSTASAAISAVGHIGSAVGGMISGGTSGAASLSGFGPPGVVVGAMAGGVSGAMNGLAGLAQDALNAKPTFPKSGSLGGPAGVMGHQQAYICLHRPAMAKPKYQSKYMGYPSFITRKVSDLVGTGFNAFSDVRLQGLGLLDTEIAELTTLLKGGVYL